MATFNANQTELKVNDVLQVPLDAKPVEYTAKPPQPKEQPLPNSKSEPDNLVSDTKDIDYCVPTERNRSEPKLVTRVCSKGDFMHCGTSLTERAKNLSEKEIQWQEIDIFKPDLVSVSPDHRGKRDFGKTNHADFQPKARIQSSPAAIEGGAQQKMSPKKQKIRRRINSWDESMRDRVVADGWKQLSDEERTKLEIDIFKPLDFSEILLNRMKANNSGKIITSLSELDI